MSVIGAAWFPGSMRAIAPVMTALASRGWATGIVSSDAAWPVAARLGLTRAERTHPDDVEASGVSRMLDATPTSLALTGIGECAMAELHWLAAVRQAGIPSLAILDTWGDYHRLARASISAGEYPDVLIVMNEQARLEVETACRWPSIVAAGQPGLDEFLTDERADDRGDARARLSLEAARDVVVFCSQPIAQLFGRSLGYDQYEALALLRATLTADTLLVVTAHPRDDLPTLRRAAGDRAVVLEQYDPATVYTASDVVVSCFSACLLEAALMMRPTVSLQPNLRGHDRSRASVLGIAESAFVAERVPLAIEHARRIGADRGELSRRRACVGIEPGAVSRVVAIAEQLLKPRLSPA
jgi:hypothetical protein